MVRRERLELSHLTAPEPKSGVSTNFTTPAQQGTLDANNSSPAYNGSSIFLTFQQP